MYLVFNKYCMFYEWGFIVEDIRQYILSVVAAASICAIIGSVVGKKGSYGEIIKLLCGLFVLITAIAPWANIQIRQIGSFIESINEESLQAVNEGHLFTQQATAQIIKEQTEAYIMERAVSLGLDLHIEVTLDNAQPPQPSAVKIKGAASPFARQTLSRYICEDLGIPEEKQAWT